MSLLQRESNCLVRLLRDDAGVTAVEYGLIAALISIAAVVIMSTQSAAI